MGLNFGDIGRWSSGKGYDPQQMRQQQLDLSTKAIKKISAAEKGPAVTTGEMQDAANVSKGLGLAGAQALAQGGTGLGGGFNAAQQKGAQEGAADVSAKNTAAALAGIQKYKADQLAKQYGVVQVAGESAWKEAELDAQRGQGLISNAIKGITDLVGLG